MFNPYAATPTKRPGDQFEITHIDGYQAKERVSYIKYIAEGDYWLYICDSCAVYSDRDFNPIIKRPC